MDEITQIDLNHYQGTDKDFIFEIVNDDDTGRSAANLYIGGLQDSNFMRITPFHENPKIRGNDAIPDIGASNLRTPAIIWVTNDKWID